jgi:putative two-component system response regulator
MNGVELIRRLRAQDLHRDIPLLVVTAHDEDDIRLDALQAGATDFLSKPVNAVEFRARFLNIVMTRRAQVELKDRAAWLQRRVAEATKRLIEQEEELIIRLTRAAEYRDNETGQHIVRVAAYAREIAEELGCDEEQSRLISLATPMHDIGKVAVSDTILLKAGSLDPDEWDQMKQHTVAGADFLSGGECDLIRLGAEIARSHHERWDGTGYPQGLAGEAIPLAARIVAVADVFDALTSRRPYKPAWPVEMARWHIEGESGSHFDPACVRAFVARFPRILRIREQSPDGTGETVGAAVPPLRLVV